MYATSNGFIKEKLSQLWDFFQLRENIVILSNGLFTLPDSDSESDWNSDYCTMQKFPIGLDSDFDPLIEI